MKQLLDELKTNIAKTAAFEEKNKEVLFHQDTFGGRAFHLFIGRGGMRENIR